MTFFNGANTIKLRSLSLHLSKNLKLRKEVMRDIGIPAYV